MYYVTCPEIYNSYSLLSLQQFLQVKMFSVILAIPLDSVEQFLYCFVRSGFLLVSSPSTKNLSFIYFKIKGNFAWEIGQGNDQGNSSYSAK
jgi:hypothetical protein